MGGHPFWHLILVVLYRTQGSWFPGRPHGASWSPPAPPPQHLTLLLLRLLLCLLIHLRGMHPLLSIPGCCIPSWHVVRSNSERRLKFSHYSYHLCRRRCRLQLVEKRSESERKLNWLPWSIRTSQKGFGVFEKNRCDIKPNETFELYSERIRKGFQAMLDVCGKYPPQKTSLFFWAIMNQKKKYSRNFRKLIRFILKAPLTLTLIFNVVFLFGEQTIGRAQLY